MTLSEIESATIIALTSKWKITLEAQDVVLMIRYIREADMYFTSHKLARKRTPCLTETALRLGLNRAHKV